MDVFGHEHKGDQLECLFRTSPIERGSQLTPPAVLGEKRHSPVTRKCQLVQLTHLLKPP